MLEKAPLGKYIWNHEHRFGFIKYSKTLPIDLDHGDFNPHLSFLLYPFGLFSDANTNVTLQVKIVVPDNCPPIPITDTFNLSWEILYTRKANSGTGRLFACSKKPLKIPFDRGMIYVHNFLPHDRIKQCRCEAFEIHMHTKYCSSEVSSTANETFAQDLESGVTPSGKNSTHLKTMLRWMAIGSTLAPSSFQNFGSVVTLCLLIIYRGLCDSTKTAGLQTRE